MKINNSENLVAHLPRIEWDEAFMAMICVYAMRSPDTSCKHGCVIVKDNIPIGWGYNGFPRGGKDDSIYPTTRPRKYTFMSHSESNALSNRALNERGCTAYITGKPCSMCVVRMIQDGVNRIVYGQITSAIVDNNDWENSCLMADNCGVELVEFSIENRQPYAIMELSQRYLKLKGWT